MISRNSVKHGAATGEPIRGIHLTFPATAVIEVLASEGLDFVYLDGEHGCFDWRDIELMCITAERHGLTPIARIPDPSSATITRFLDRGIRGIVVPHVESVDDAKRVIDAAYFAPEGERSFGAGRPEYWENGADRAAYMAACNKALSVCMMIETAAALAAADRIAKVPGVDYLSFGLLDLAQSLGHPGQAMHPEVRSAVAECTRRINQAGKRVREDFMKFAWVNDVLRAGMRALVDARPATAAHSA
ncbi:MAG TPA: aldolase/citrate lyase family protein [Casimicrobiaceae bacterium]|jgi:2-keto-3-deoxy-L-rhamnonate aldolase RhmA|nr:aldolase/citrate lyase family protein [Casimicrobiaceae bacterium]